MNSDLHEVVLQWFEYASQDLKAAQEIAKADYLHPRIACFLAQQSVEKSIKAILTLNEVEFKKTHDLEQLVLETPDKVRLFLDNLDISWLTGWAVTGRYPGDWPEATRLEAKRAIQIAVEVYDHIKHFCLQENDKL